MSDKVRVRAVERVAVEEEGIARLRFHMDVLEQFHGFPDTLHVCAGLAAVDRVFDPPHPVAAPENLETAVLAGGAGLTEIATLNRSGNRQPFLYQ